MHVCVIGAGVVGVTTAWYLARQGLKVTLVDRLEAAAQGASYANGGQLSYSYVAPLAGPGVLGNLPDWLLNADSPLRFHPRLDLHQWRWCLNFMRACTAGRSRQTTAELLELSYYSRELVHQLTAREALQFNYRRNGKLIVYRDKNSLAQGMQQVRFQAALGSQQHGLSTEQCVALEPALAHIAPALAGAIHTPSEEVGDCRLFTQALLDRLLATGQVETLFGTEVLGLRRERQRIAAVVTAQGELQVDGVVVCSGVASRPLLKDLGMHLPLYPLKGYSLDVPLTEDNARTLPGISVTDSARKVVYAPLGKSLRVAAMVDMGTGNDRIDPVRIDLLKKQVRETFPGLDLSGALPWAGLRPATALSKPIIDVTRLHNLWLNVGHGALGFTLACGSASALAALVCGEQPAINLAPFRAGQVC
ncbi:D-amino acid dehydrogenase [Pseudomonas sp. PB120]|uniref:D-amino acid dehydrogenase n=1 Tax=Pseudomonas sp. PB120 TaxID=2494700 RepID=UPI0012FD9478|nr:D-amino acid dehydrogenase [Pseudomonas sp. PB120]MVV47544.1 D-amino acid dehydrogenase [Pseudomonas sp. PB120]